MKKRNVALGELFNVGSSKRVLKSQWQTEGVPFYRGREITRLSADGFVNNELFISENDYAEYASKYGVPTPGDIVITAIGTIGNSYIVREGDRFYFKDASVLWLNKDAEVSSEFINLWLKSPLFFDQLDKGNGATVDTLTIKRLKGVLVDLPPLPEQKRIVAILDEAFAGIDAAVANTEKNIANGRELFESYLNGVFTRKGEGWVEKTLGEVCRINSKLVDPREPEFIDLPHLGAGNMVSRTGELIEIQTAREEGLISGKFLFDEKMVLYSKIRPYLMKACMPDFKGLCSADVYPLSSIDGNIDRSYLFHLLMSQHFTDYAIVGSGRAGMPKVNRDHLFKYSVSLPDIAEQRQFAAKFDDLFAETNRLETIYQQKLAALAELKQTLLQKAFAGELTTLPEKALEEAVA